MIARLLIPWSVDTQHLTLETHTLENLESTIRRVIVHICVLPK